MCRGSASWRISVAYIGSALAAAWVLGLDPLHAILSGSLLFGALFMAADWVTSPTGRSAQVVYGIGCGGLTILIREFTVYPEGVTFAILFMNGLTPLLDVMVVDSVFGQVAQRRRRQATVATAAGLALITLLAGVGAHRLAAFGDAFYVRGTVRYDLRAFFPDGGRYAMPYATDQAGVTAEQVYARDGALGWLVYSEAHGYYGPVRIVTALDRDGRVIGLRVVEHQESATLGGLVRRPSFLNQFLRRSAANPESVTRDLAAITGATISSRAVAVAVEQALRFRESPAAPGGALPLTDGVFEGSASGYQGRIDVEVTVAGGQISAVMVVRHGETRRLAEPAFARTIEQVIARQVPDVDAVTGATGSSRGLMAAIRTALEP